MKELGVESFEIFIHDIVSRGASAYILDPDYSNSLEFITGEAYAEMDGDVGEFIMQYAVRP